MDRSYIDRIRLRLDATGKSVRRASMDAGLSETALRDIIANESQSPRIETLHKIAISLDADPAWLIFGTGDELAKAQEVMARMAPAMLQVVGEVAAGRWMEIDENVDEPAFEPVPVQPDPRWRMQDQYGLIVRGSSVNRVAIDGDILACVDVVAAGYRPKPDDLVIVEMRRNAGLLRQRTAKRYQPTDTHIELWPDSDDPRWQTPIIVPRGDTPLHTMVMDDEGRIEVSITALVTWVHRPVQRRGRR